MMLVEWETWDLSFYMPPMKEISLVGILIRPLDLETYHKSQMIIIFLVHALDIHPKNAMDMLYPSQLPSVNTILQSKNILYPADLVDLALTSVQL